MTNVDVDRSELTWVFSRLKHIKSLVQELMRDVEELLTKKKVPKQ